MTHNAGRKNGRTNPPSLKKIADKIYMLIRQSLPDSRLKQILQRIVTEMAEKKMEPLTSRQIDELFRLLSAFFRGLKQSLYRYFKIPEKEKKIRGKVLNIKAFEDDITGWYTGNIISGCTPTELINHLAKVLDLGTNPKYLGRKIDENRKLK